MDFGIVASWEVNNIDFNLPIDGDFTLKTFENRKKAESSDIRVGLAKWGRKEWLGKLYPNKTKEADFLKEYSKHFNTIELNAVFYSIPPEDLIRKWKGMVAPPHKDNFLFLPKMSRVISHIKRLNQTEKETSQFIETVKLFGQHLGPILLQVGDNFGPKKLLDLELFIKELPTDQRFFIELRHEEWFSNTFHRKTVFNLFAKYNIGTVITDSAGRRDCLHMELTIPEAYIRFNGIGDDFKTIDHLRIEKWIDRIEQWLKSGLEKVYFIISRHDEQGTPELAKFAIERLNARLGANIPLIKWHIDTHIPDNSEG